MNLYSFVEIGIAFVPIILFLVSLQLFDNFQLVSFRPLLLALLIGALTAFTSVAVNSSLSVWYDIPYSDYSRFIAPFSEEILKILFVVWLIWKNRVGFMVDAAIFGFAIGAGFAIVENIYYLTVLTDASLTTWFVRGFGTAVMHGGTTAIAAIISKNLADRKGWPFMMLMVPGFFTAAILHMLYNLFLLPPITVTLIILVTLPPVIYAIFKVSEKQTREWLNNDLDDEMEMLQMIREGNITETPIGQYLQSVRDKFPDYLMADMLGYLRIYLELSVKAKGVLIMKENEITPPMDEETKAQFKELEFLEQSIGPSGKLALEPLLGLTNRDVWQLHTLQQEEGI